MSCLRVGGWVRWRCLCGWYIGRRCVLVVFVVVVVGVIGEIPGFSKTSNVRWKHLKTYFGKIILINR